MSDKYYTPEIEEFHIGFEYENQQMDGSRYLNQGMRWHKQVYAADSIRLHKLACEITAGNIRVKYLDESDFEQLRLVPNERGEYPISETHEIQFRGLDYMPTPHIKVVRIGEYHDPCCAIEVKNKSELKRILKQVNIS